MVYVVNAPLVERAPGDPATVMAFTARAQGDLSLAGGGAAARERALGLLGLDLDDAVFMQQVHGPAVRRVGAADRGRGARDAAGAVPGTDALVTTEPGVALVVLAADCVPVLLAAPGAGVAAAHAGRRGVAAGVVGAAVAALAGTAGVRPRDVVARAGPAIGGCCYEVGREVALEVTALVPAARATTRWGTCGLDLPGAVLAQLRAAGVERAETVGGCTRCDPERWFSHRASTADGVPEGRHAGVVAMGATPPRSGPESSLH